MAQGPGDEDTSGGVSWGWGPTFPLPELPLAGPRLPPRAVPRAPSWELGLTRNTSPAWGAGTWGKTLLDELELRSPSQP